MDLYNICHEAEKVLQLEDSKLCRQLNQQHLQVVRLRSFEELAIKVKIINGFLRI
jgi:hypothetical protein